MEMQRYRPSTREPVYTVSPDRPVYMDYRQSRLPERDTYRDRFDTESEDTKDSDLDSYTVEDPPDGGMWGWLVVLACAVLHVCSEMTQVLFYNTTVIASLRNPRLANASVATYTEYMVFEDVLLTGEIVAAVGSVLLGYRVTAVFGSLCTLGGFLGASWLHPTDDKEAMGFLVGFLGGFGVACWRFTAYVAVMEYFTTYRLIAIALSGFGRAVGLFAGYGVLAQPLKTAMEGDIQDVMAMTEWWVYYRSMVAIPAAAAICCLIIRPLRHSPAQSRNSHLQITCNLHDTYLCRGFMLVLVMAVYFMYYMGATLPATTMIFYMITKGFVVRHILGAMFTLAAGVLVGYVLLGFWSKNAKLYKSLIWMGVFSLGIGAFTIQVPLYEEPYLSYIVAYMGVVGIGQVLFESVLRYVIPIGFGRTHIKWIEGLLGLTAGCATICNNFIVKEIEEEKPQFIGNTFYLAASGFLAAGVLAILVMNVAMCTGFKDENNEKHVPLPPKETIASRSSRPEYSYGRDRDMRDRDPSPPRYFQGFQYR